MEPCASLPRGSRNDSRLAERAHRAEKAADGIVPDLRELFSSLKTGPTALFGVASDGALPLPDLSERFGLWLANTEQLSKWVSYRERADRGHSLGLGQHHRAPRRRKA